MYSLKAQFYPALILFLLTKFALHGQVMDPWTGKQVNLASGKTTTRSGIFEGFSAQYGICAHKATTDSYTALPYILIPSEANKQAPVLIVFNGGPGSSNLTLPGGMDSLTRVFHMFKIFRFTAIWNFMPTLIMLLCVEKSVVGMGVSCASSGLQGY